MIVFTREELQDEQMLSQLDPEYKQYNYLTKYFPRQKQKYQLKELIMHLTKPRLLHLLTLLDYKPRVCNAFRAVLEQRLSSVNFTNASSFTNVNNLNDNSARMILAYLQTLPPEEIGKKLKNTFKLFKECSPEDMRTFNFHNPITYSGFDPAQLKVIGQYFTLIPSSLVPSARYIVFYYSYLTDDFYSYKWLWGQSYLGRDLYNKHNEEMIKAFSTNINKNSIFAVAVNKYLEEGKALLKGVD